MFIFIPLDGMYIFVSKGSNKKNIVNILQRPLNLIFFYLLLRLWEF